MLFYMDLLDFINVTQSFLCHGPCDCNIILCALLLFKLLNYYFEFWYLSKKILKHNSRIFKYNSNESNKNRNK